jgi:hypothetical protein
MAPGVYYYRLEITLDDGSIYVLKPGKLFKAFR